MARPRKATKINVTMEDGTVVSASVVERMGYNHDIGGRVSEVEFEGRVFKAVNFGGAWRKWGARDRVRPLIEHIARCAQSGEASFR